MIAVLLAGPVQAYPLCQSRAEVVDHLHGKYRERVIVIASTESGTLFEVWANALTRTWTATITDPTGKVCYLSAGQDYDHIIYVVGEDG